MQPQQNFTHLFVTINSNINPKTQNPNLKSQAKTPKFYNTSMVTPHAKPITQITTFSTKPKFPIISNFSISPATIDLSA